MIIVALAFALVAADPPAPPMREAPVEATPAPAVVEQKPKILVLDFRDDGVGASAVRVIHDTLVSHLSKDARLDLMSSEDVRRAVAREAERREATNCDEEGCIAEIAEALGAQLTIFGTAGRLGDLVVINVNLYDARSARSVGRETIEVGSLEQLPGPLRAAGDRLIAQLGLTPRDEGFERGPIFWTGVGLGGAGFGGLVVGSIVYFANEQAVREKTTFVDKSNAKFAQDAGGYTAAIGAAVLGVGMIVTAGSLALE